jgi:hypothetical protein
MRASAPAARGCQPATRVGPIRSRSSPVCSRQNSSRMPIRDYAKRLALAEVRPMTGWDGTKGRKERTNHRSPDMGTPCRSGTQQRGMSPIWIDEYEPRDAVPLSLSAFQGAYSLDRHTHLRRGFSAHPLAERWPVASVRLRFARRPLLPVRMALPKGPARRRVGSRAAQSRWSSPPTDLA